MHADGDMLELADTYAAAVLDLAFDQSKVAEVEQDFDALAQVYLEDERFAAFIDSPVIGVRQKEESLIRIFENRIEELTVRFLRVLAEHERLNLLGVLGDRYRVVRDRRLGRIHVEVNSATALTPDQRDALRGHLGSKLGGEVVLQENVEPELIGGLLLRIGDTLFDGSVRTRLTKLRESITARGSHEIQGGRDLLAD
jgi:F-type H+-transporting ATPase subunit delta